MRSRAAASVLATAGFRTVSSMAGGIKAWRGFAASGPPEAGMAFFTAAANAADLIALAWQLEEGSRRFYSEIARMPSAGEAARLFSTLVNAEEKHTASLLELYRGVVAGEPGADFPQGRAVAQGAEDRMEGGVKVSEALAWAKDRDARELLELSMALETDSYDLYIKMSRSVPGEDARRIFSRLQSEEQQHLALMADMLDQTFPVTV